MCITIHRNYSSIVRDSQVITKCYKTALVGNCFMTFYNVVSLNGFEKVLSYVIILFVLISCTCLNNRKCILLNLQIFKGYFII